MYWIVISSIFSFQFNLLQPYHMSKGSCRLFTVAYNIGTYRLFSDLIQLLELQHSEVQLWRGLLERLSGGSVHEWIKEHYRDVQLAWTQSSAWWLNQQYSSWNAVIHVYMTQSWDKQLTQPLFLTTMTTPFITLVTFCFGVTRYSVQLTGSVNKIYYSQFGCNWCWCLWGISSIQ